ncbi:MAG: hypothetical protein PHI22_01440 [Bacilli bacterium]|nr:hypothetical protein [Bacilli bacterium]MDD4298821.1 hypothetical protein [Bacilli bacterium]MDD4644018.1 hypothetical protein [Bacilli bacterium]
MINYQFDKLYVGMLAVNQQEGNGYSVIYKDDILCIVKDGLALDLFTGKVYKYFGNDGYRIAPLDRKYVFNIMGFNLDGFKNTVFSKKTLARVAQALNNKERFIKIPEEYQTGVKRK